ncbi:hypothetical protein DL96DRAFT_1605652 [Flagelloscypha sp. PMI_526]|nr:hypothetical protein DL96DRAFT_1605652 [Flagelloscypha sp. PMI_526]
MSDLSFWGLNLLSRKSSRQPMTSNGTSPRVLPVEICSLRPLASLCKPFAHLVTQNRTHRISFSIIPSPFPDVSIARVAAADTKRRLKSRVEAGGSADTRHIIFYGQAPSTFIATYRNPLLKAPLFPLAQIHKELQAVDSLSILLNSHARILGTIESLSANLRELSISVGEPDGTSSLIGSSNIPLPRLEIMRFAYVERYDRAVEPSHFFQQIASIYSNWTLRELELHIVYPSRTVRTWSRVAHTLLPQAHTFPKLTRFSIVTERRNTRIDISQPICIAAFIRRHASTLRCIRVHKFNGVFEDLFSNDPPSFATQPAFSVAIRQPGLVMFEEDALRIVKMGLIEAEISRSLTPFQQSFPNLRRLVIRVWHLTLESFDEFADRLPQLLSLCVKYNEVNITSHSIQERLSMEPYTSISLSRSFVQNPPAQPPVRPCRPANWRLRDLTIVPGFIDGPFAPVSPNYALMKKVAKLLPNVESFEGRGDMFDPPEPWERSWPWKKNVYI